jgi:hypothetical protein
MLGPEPDERPPSDLRRALGAVSRTQSLLLIELDQACRGDPAFISAFRRWSELFTALRLHLLRVESRLLQHVLAGQREPSYEFAPPGFDREEAARRWSGRLGAWFQQLHIESTYLRLPTVLDPDQEPVTADITTDLAALAEIAEATMPALAASQEGASHGLDDLAFFHVLGPWKNRGFAALDDVLRWLAEMSREHDTL